MKYIYFFKPENRYGEFSQWYMSDFVDKNNIQYHCCEQYMMYQKAILFNDVEVANQILASTSPYEMKKLGKQVKNFNQEVWDSNKYNIVKNANLYKFGSNLELKSFLLNTGDSILVEASPFDKIWGIGISFSEAMEGKEWRGQNLLGKALMDVREYYRKNK